MAGNIVRTGIDKVSIPSSADPTFRIAICLIVVGAAFWFASALGLDPGNILAQRLDLFDAHLPSAQRFAERPFLDALMDYPAAPLPLFYIIAGGILALGGTVFTLQAATVCVGLLLLWLVYTQTVQNRGFPQASAFALIAAVMISPWFRGTTVYANTDPFPLALLVAAFVIADRRGPARPGRALALACLAVWVRQFYIFGAAGIVVRYLSWSDRGRLLRLALIGVAMSLPVAAVFAYWGGPTPPRFSYHIASSGPLKTAPVLLLIFAIYMAPSMLATALLHRREFFAAMRRPGFLLCMALLAVISVAVVFNAGHLSHSTLGGGAAVVALEQFGVPAGIRGALLGLAVFLAGVYLAYLVAQAPRANSVVVFALLAFLPTGIIFQRYFDPLLTILFGCVLRTKETDSVARTWIILLYPAVDLALSIVGFFHYGAILGTATGS